MTSANEHETGADKFVVLSGGIGGAITGDNRTTTHLLNTKRLAIQMKSPPAAALIENHPGNHGGLSPVQGASVATPTQSDVEMVVRAVIEEILKQRQ